ncbi:immunoglobulin-like and fibronectin type III domain-containing protein 1 [Ambystoma mexicanum]|uniref:immunoglobulin-like and fibronectin type III domain-containing protein 1 n=1 Tax=Ambystoma mexicanum TaxID=8296 RepID=UPI0037E73E89
MKKSSLPGVKLTQTAEEVPTGCSAPGIERKPIPLTIQEGKNAMFKVVVNGVPRPEVKWQRAKGDLSNTSKYKCLYDSIMDEFILQVFNVTPDDEDSYRCTAWNAYGEATCVASLKIIEIGFKKKFKQPNEKNQEEMKKEFMDFRKNLKKRVAKPVVKQEPVSQEKVMEVLLNAEKKDYEKICFQYGITDFRGVLKRLQQMKKDREDQQAKYVTAVSNLKHIKVNSEGNGVFELEMELKNPNSKIFLYKDGEMIRYVFDAKKSHSLRQIGKRYIFTILDVKPKDVGLYQVKVEDADVFSTELDLNSIPVSFVSQLKEARSPEGSNATFQCTLSRPCQEAGWRYKDKMLEPGSKYDISISPDGLTHQLVVKDTRLMDKGSYGFVAGIRSSCAWLVVEASKDNDFDSKGRRRKIDGGSSGNDQSPAQSEINGMVAQECIKNFGNAGMLGDQNSDHNIENSDLLRNVNVLDGKHMEGKDLLIDSDGLQAGKGKGYNDEFGGVGSWLGGLDNDSNGLPGIGCSTIDGTTSGINSLLEGTASNSNIQEGFDSSHLNGPKSNGGITGDQDGNRAFVDGLGPNSGQNERDDTDSRNDTRESARSGIESSLGSNSQTSSGKSMDDALGTDSLDGISSLPSGPTQTGSFAHEGTENGSGDTRSGQLSPEDGSQVINGVVNGIPTNGLSSMLSESNETSGLKDASLEADSNHGPASGMVNGDNHGRQAKMADFDVSEASPKGLSKNKDKRAGQDTHAEPACRFACGLSDVQAQIGKAAELSCTLTSHHVEGAWFKDGIKLTPQDTVTIVKDGSVHKLVIEQVEDAHAGRYTFEAAGHKTEASVVVLDPPQVPQDLLDGLFGKPLVIRAGQNAMVKVPFRGRKPIKATWYQDEVELADDGRIHIDQAANFSQLSITKASRKDSGNIKLRLKNGSGTLEANLKLVVLDKPQPPVGPIEVVESSSTAIGIQWKPPKDDGGKSLQHYVVERQQVGRNTWLKVGEVLPGSTRFSTSKVDHGKKYYFRVRAVNAEGASEALESEEIMAGSKVLPGAPPAPSVIGINSQAITLSWMAPHNKGSSRILGFHVEKRKSGSHSWTAVTEEPITERKCTVTDLGQGLQYEFRVITVSDIGPGDPSAPSESVFARDPMRPPAAVRDLKVTDSSYTSISLSWVKPPSENRDYAKGYFVEMRPVESLHWTRCNNSLIGMTSYTIKGLRPKDAYYLRVIAVNDGGLGEANELNTQVLAMPSAVRPKFLKNASLKSFMAVRSGNSIRVQIPFEASPEPEVLWQKDGLPVSRRATMTSREGLSQLIIPCADYTDSGIYTIVLKNHFGKESFKFEIQVADIPKPPGPVRLEENVANTVTVVWGPSPDEKHDGNLHYVVMKKDSTQQSWHVVGDPVYTTRFTITRVIPGRQYHFRVLAKNDMGLSDPSDVSEAWSISKERAKFLVKKPFHKPLDQRQAPVFIARLKPHVVPSGFDCRMSCAVRGNPEPQITWYKNGKSIAEDPHLWKSNIVGVCSLMVPCITLEDSGEYTVIAKNILGEATCKATLAVRDSSF